MGNPRVEVRRSSRRKRTVTAFRERDTIVVLVPQQLSRTDEQRYVDDLVKKVLAREARAAAPASDVDLAQRARELTACYLESRVSDLRPLRSVVWVSNQSQRWGSCTPGTGAIRLSDRLQVMPEWVIDYVLLHELAHLAEPTHSARFRGLVDVYPRAERAKGFLDGFLIGRGQPSAEPGAELDASADDVE